MTFAVFVVFALERYVLCMCLRFPSAHVAGAWAAALVMRTSGVPRAAARVMAAAAAS
ncbi:hypothetical protein [Streptomyces hiroshimensis]|uniref:Uncharacterized protein n=1 Tax=Streptomyces hiroshimensis TaxID=66424 RepID=A0ABQ2Y8K3_9ACTN|nr:hypothetical protein [Streptomyces hiroshimensis]GGX73480.1 hypothetical protein GCM10010324_18430 [Streptomyces hiroshimensis]